MKEDGLPQVTMVGPRLALARVRVASQEVAVVNPARAQLVAEETQFLKQASWSLLVLSYEFVCFY